MGPGDPVFPCDVIAGRWAILGDDYAQIPAPVCPGEAFEAF